ncbi:MAG: SH3 domain-containing protein [Treponema sp.]|nr:SH3 domain-containing protein [Treponema sp.]
MKKNMFIIFLALLSSLTFCNEIEYKIIKSNDLNLEIPSGTIIKVNEDDIYRSIENRHAFVKLFYTYKNKIIQLLQDEVELSKSIKIFQDSELKKFIPAWYFDVLDKRDINLIYNYQPKWYGIEEIKNHNALPGEGFIENFYPEAFEINNLYFFMSRGQGFPISKIVKEKEFYKIYIHRTQDAYKAEDFPYPDEYEKVIEDENFILFMKFDGDYVDVWINNLKCYIGKYALASFDTYIEIHNLLIDKFNSSKVTWPRHADGTCDYDDSKTITTQTSKEVFSSNVAKNKIMTVTENLKLRSAEATTSKVLTVMAAGTKLKILELGHSETIDGITSNWVKIEVQADAKDREGKSIKAGTTGWCYGGYLEETKQNDDKQSAGKDEKKRRKNDR